MEREKLSLATTIMAMDMDMVDMDTMATMEREKLKPPLLLSQDIIIMAMDMIMDMVDMDTMDTMEREKLGLATIMVMDMDMDMVDMVTMDIMERERLSPVIIIMAMDMVMVMDTMV